MGDNVDAIREIRVPHEIVNDDFVKIVEWKLAHGAQVRKGDDLVVIETSKSAMDVAAETNGFLKILRPAGIDVAVGEMIGQVSVQPVANLAPSPVDAAANRSAGSPGVVFSKSAQQMIEDHGIDPSLFANHGLVREQDIQNFLDQQDRVAVNDSPPESLDAEPPTAVKTSTDSANGEPVGLFGDAKQAAGDRQRSLIWVAWNYFYRNWLLGNLVRIAPRGLDLFLHRRRGVQIGRGCFVDPSATLETAYPENVRLGDDVRVAAGAIIMTHIKPPHYLRQCGAVPVVLKPVVLEDHCFIGVNAVIMPGVTIGKASVVASGAAVFVDVPPLTMVSGNPAQVVKRFSLQESES